MKIFLISILISANLYASNEPCSRLRESLFEVGSVVKSAVSEAKYLIKSSEKNPENKDHMVCAGAIGVSTGFEAFTEIIENIIYGVQCKDSLEINIDLNQKEYNWVYNMGFNMKGQVLSFCIGDRPEGYPYAQAQEVIDDMEKVGIIVEKIIKGL
jgi:hypothetical protein